MTGKPEKQTKSESDTWIPKILKMTETESLVKTIHVFPALKAQSGKDGGYRAPKKTKAK